MSSSARLPRLLVSMLVISLSRASSSSNATSSMFRMPVRFVELWREMSHDWPLYSLASKVIIAPVLSSQSPSGPSSCRRRGVIVPDVDFLVAWPLTRCDDDLLLVIGAPVAEGVRFRDLERERGLVAELARSRGVVGADLPCRYEVLGRGIGTPASTRTSSSSRGNLVVRGASERWLTLVDDRFLRRTRSACGM